MLRDVKQHPTAETIDMLLDGFNEGQNPDCAVTGAEKHILDKKTNLQ